MAATTTTLPTGTKRSRTKRRPLDLRSVTRHFEEWLAHRREAATLDRRIDELRSYLLEACEEFGEVDDKGSQWLTLPTPVIWNDGDQAYAYTALKRQRRITPAVPQPDPKKAEKLLRKKGLWLSPRQEEAIQQIRKTCPFVRLDVLVDSDALGKAVFQNLISDAEYESTLLPQKESWSLLPTETA